jgi:hypothetical protein
MACKGYIMETPQQNKRTYMTVIMKNLSQKSKFRHDNSSSSPQRFCTSKKADIATSDVTCQKFAPDTNPPAAEWSVRKIYGRVGGNTFFPSVSKLAK